MKTLIRMGENVYESQNFEEIQLKMARNKKIFIPDFYENSILLKVFIKNM
jgi:hypothetical protein